MKCKYRVREADSYRYISVSISVCVFVWVCTCVHTTHLFSRVLIPRVGHERRGVLSKLLTQEKRATGTEHRPWLREERPQRTFGSEATRELWVLDQEEGNAQGRGLGAGLLDRKTSSPTSVILLVFQPRAVSICSLGGTSENRRGGADAGSGSHLDRGRVWHLHSCRPPWSCLRTNIWGSSSVKGGPGLKPFPVQSASLALWCFYQETQTLNICI